MKYICWLAAAVLFSPMAHAQEAEKAQPTGTILRTTLVKPLVGVAGQVAATARDLATFRDPQWSILTLGQIGAASADAYTSMSNLHHCSYCSETGVSRMLVGSRPDAHKYVTAGIFEIGIEAVTAHYFRNRRPAQKWYWRVLWNVPQSLSLYEHVQATRHNAALGL